MERDDGIERNRQIIAGNLELFRDHYWDLYDRYGFSFMDGYRCWLTEFYLDHNAPSRDDDRDEPWRG